MPRVANVTWKDELGPAYAFGAGAAAPSMTVITGSTHVRGLTFGPGDRVDVAVQFNHDVVDPGGTGTIPLSPHVHYSFVDNPTAGNTVRWKFTYMGCKPATDGSVTFADTLSTISSTRHVLTSTEIRKHYLRPLTDVTVPSSAWGESYIWWGTLELSTLSTIAAGKVALLAFDIHKQVKADGSRNIADDRA
jgi:hypothetical protein